ncbi:MAG: DUF2318 domain-containing protein [Clostridiales Family XIII bacterium]|jgi:uncharacterized membrane protein|nr:DUF2318 domain-containing protein [Clostridiales Family XIII bacterium]
MSDSKWKNGKSLSVYIIITVLALMLALVGCDSAGDSDTGSDSSSVISNDAGDDGSEAVSDEAPPSDEAAGAEAIDSGGALTFNASDVTEQASFIPLTVDGTYMEIIAVRAPDDTVRTAFNTCQVCWDSGRGYYIQEADEFVCQNCGNRFNVSDVEIVRGGCNPVPIEAEYKTVDGDSIAIGYDLLKEAVPLFENWKS